MTTKITAIEVAAVSTRREIFSPCCAAPYMATNLTMLPVIPMAASWAMEVVASTRDQMPNCSMPMERISTL